MAGTARPRQPNPQAVAALWHWLVQYWALWKANFARLDAVLAETEPQDDPDRTAP